MKRRLPIYVFVVLATLTSCTRSENEQLRLVARAEVKLDEVYFRGDLESAEHALHDYLKTLEETEKSASGVDVMKMIHSGRALALARLEHLRAHREARSPNLEPAVREFRKTSQHAAALSNNEAIDAIEKMIAGDAQFVPWIKAIRE